MDFLKIYIPRIEAFLVNKTRNYVLFSNMVIAILGLVSGKLIAVYILPEDFGRFSLQFATYTFFLTLFISPFLQYLKATNNDLLPRLGSKSFMFLGVLLLIFANGLMLGFLHMYQDLQGYLLSIVLVTFFSGSVAVAILSDYLKVKDELITFSHTGIIKSLVSLLILAGAVLLFDIHENHTLLLWFVQLAGITAVILLFGARYRFYTSGIRVKFSTFLRKYVRYAAPLIVLALWTWLNNYFDRYALEYFLNTEAVGIYNANYGLGSKFFLLLSPIFLTLLTPKIFSISTKDYKIKAIKKQSLRYLKFGVPLLLLIFFSAEFIGSLLLSEKYSSGFHIIIWVALAFFFFTMANHFESFFYAEKKTKVILHANIASALLNVTFNVLLIPKYGILGAAMATCLAFALHLTYIIIVFNKQ